MKKISVEWIAAASLFLMGVGIGLFVIGTQVSDLWARSNPTKSNPPVPQLVTQLSLSDLESRLHGIGVSNIMTMIFVEIDGHNFMATLEGTNCSSMVEIDGPPTLKRAEKPDEIL